MGPLTRVNARTTEEWNGVEGLPEALPQVGARAVEDERKAVGAGGRSAGAARRIRCEACGRMIDVCPDPGTGLALLYAMHLREEAAANSKCGSDVS